jgi:hypothetical protein
MCGSVVCQNIQLMLLWRPTNTVYGFLTHCRSIAEKLGPERTSKLKIVGTEEVERSFYGQLVLGEGVASSLDEQLTKEAQKAGELTN